MLARHLRIAALAVAAWAVLFAPGALDAGAATGDPDTRAEHLGAAVVAPTFGDGQLLTHTGCRRIPAELETCDLQAASVPPSPVLAIAVSFAAWYPSALARVAREPFRIFVRRGPPLS